jgi:hypothetical protein
MANRRMTGGRDRLPHQGRPRPPGARARSPIDAVPVSPVDVFPRWEGAPGYEPVARALERLLELPPIGRTPEGVDIISGADLTAFQAIVAMQQAHPVYVGDRQLQVLPPWSTASDWDAVSTALRYADELRLPFDPLFLDVTARNGEPAWIGRDDATEFGLYGALLFRGTHGLSAAMVGDGQLAIVPFGVLRLTDDHVTCPWAVADAISMPPQAAAGTLIVGGSRHSRHGELWFGEAGYAGSMGRRPSERMQALAGAVSAELAASEDPSVPSRAFATPARIWAGSGGVMQPLIGALKLGEVGRFGFDGLSAPWRAHTGALVGESNLVLELALNALRSMFLLDSTNVELVPAATRQVRRSAERSGGRVKIALTVRVRPRARSGRARRPGNTKRVFSHSFERSGTYRHVTRGRHARPELMRPCPRDDEAHRASGGVCRRYWVSPHVVDAGDGKPFVPKTRLVD